MPLQNLQSRAVVLGLRITQFILAIIVLGLAAHVVHWWRDWYHAFSPSQVNFLVFCAVWSILALIYLMLVPWRFSETKLHHKFVILSIEAVTMIFWFAGFIALAVFLSDRVCFGSVCSSAKAANVFAAFEWLAFALTTAMALLHGFHNQNRMDRGKADPNPNMQSSV